MTSRPPGVRRFTPARRLLAPPGMTVHLIDHRFLTHSTDVTVTILATDGKFRSEGCGVWKPVR
ncbi:hypothetical protein GCM10010230_59580 [Streptomyces narbonensis]|nr:hypothetical protein GCM10010230_59580 [Streptomyces narbonensis]